MSRSYKAVRIIIEALGRHLYERNSYSVLFISEQIKVSFMEDFIKHGNFHGYLFKVNGLKFTNFESQ